jgi:hypothetical protein
MPRAMVEAVRYLARGLAIQEQHLDLNLAILTDTRRQAYVATISGTTDCPSFQSTYNPPHGF